MLCANGCSLLLTWFSFEKNVFYCLLRYKVVYIVKRKILEIIEFIGMKEYNSKFPSVFCYREEAQEYIEMGAINSLFILGRSIGFIGKF